MASRVLCATLAIPIPAARNAIDTLLEMGEETVEKQRRLAALLMLPSPPKRQGLVSDLVGIFVCGVGMILCLCSLATKITSVDNVVKHLYRIFKI